MDRAEEETGTRGSEELVEADSVGIRVGESTSQVGVDGLRGDCGAGRGAF